MFNRIIRKYEFLELDQRTKMKPLFRQDDPKYGTNIYSYLKTDCFYFRKLISHIKSKGFSIVWRKPSTGAIELAMFIGLQLYRQLVVDVQLVFM